MRDGHLPPLAKAAVLSVALGAHVALWLAFGAPRPAVMRDDGGAPVINLIPFARAQFDGAGANEARTDATAETPRAPVTPTREPVRPQPLAQAPAGVEPAPQAAEPTPPREAATGAAADSASSSQAAASSPAEAGTTAGGGARALGAAATSSEDAYAATVLAWVERHKGRPRRHLRGAVIVRFTLDRQGRLRAIGVSGSSADAELDRLALEALRAAQPYPRPPAGAAWRTREFRVRLDYRPQGPA